jgi:phosphatidylserine/phosphatidylglycerophosphate/cardiolipin synthase-like enzyme
MDHGSYTCGDKGRCDQCPDAEFCLGRMPRLASSPTPAPAKPVPSLSTSTPSAVTSYFTPGDNCTDAIVHALSDATRTILVQAYSFTSAPIAKALLDGHKRSVQVQVILDKSQHTAKHCTADFLANQRGPTRIDAAYAMAYNKVTIIDGETAMTGSFNFTKAPRRNMPTTS